MKTQLDPGTIAKQFDEEGFLVVPSLFTREETQNLKAECRRLLDRLNTEAKEKGEKDPTFVQTGVYVGLSIQSEVFRRLNRDPRLLDVLEAIIGPNIMFWSDKVVFKADTVQFDSPWHQDWPYWKGLHKINAWIALDDVDTTNGALKLVPGSHRQPVEHYNTHDVSKGFTNRIDSAQIDESQVATAEIPAGSVIFFHDLTLHASHPNTSGRDRWAIISTFKDATADDLDYPGMAAAAVVRGHGRS